MEKKNFHQALNLSLRLGRPGSALEALNCMNNEEAEKAITSLSTTHKHKLIEFCAKWNRNSKSAFRAQMTLKLIFSSMPFEELLSDFGIRKHLESLLPFTDRYRRKIDNLRIQSRFANFAISAVKVAPVMNE